MKIEPIEAGKDEHGVGQETFGSPRTYAISERSSFPTSMPSVLARRARRSTCRLAGSITWLRTPWEQG
jgi:hypothetical protein